MVKTVCRYLFFLREFLMQTLASDQEKAPFLGLGSVIILKHGVVAAVRVAKNRLKTTYLVFFLYL